MKELDRRLTVTFAVLGLTMSLSAAARAQTRGIWLATAQDPAGRATYGTSDTTALTIGAYQFIGFFNGAPAGHRLTFGDGIAPVRLPNGAVVSAIDIGACDAASDNSLIAELSVVDKITDAKTTAGFVETTGGCRVDQLTFPPVVVDNSRYLYFVRVNLTDVDNPSVPFNAVTLHYQLLVSPAPLAATFNDVPVGHSLRQFVEALVASGITAGCGGGNYCPDAPLTRGVMAVFLAVALGLHWPN